MKRFQCLVLGLTLVFSYASMAQADLKVPQINNAQDAFAVRILENALKRSASYERVTTINKELSVPGKLEALKHQEIDVAWLSADNVNSDDVIAVALPVFKGARSYYQVVSNNPTFKNINTQTLKAARMGIERSDAMLQHLLDQGYDVSAARSPNGLMHMLDGERFDVALVPIFSGKAIPGIDARVNPQFVASLNPHYFFVHKSQPALANKVKQGMLKMHEDGSLARMFYNEPWVTAAMSLLEDSNFPIIDISPASDQSMLTQIDKEFWLDIPQDSLFTKLF